MDAQDPESSTQPVPDYTRQIDAAIKGLRIGVAREHFFASVQPDTDRALQQAMELFRKLGATTVDVTIRNPAMASPASSVIPSSEAADFHETRLKMHGDKMDALVRERLEAATVLTAVDYIKAQRIRTMLIEETKRVFQRCDVILLPAGNPPPVLEDEFVETDAPRNPPLPPRPDIFNFANVTEIPALVLPCGFTAGPPVLPIGIPLGGPHFGESVLFRVGHAYQLATDWHRRKPPLMV